MIWYSSFSLSSKPTDLAGFPFLSAKWLFFHNFPTKTGWIFILYFSYQCSVFYKIFQNDDFCIKIIIFKTFYPLLWFIFYIFFSASPNIFIKVLVLKIKIWTFLAFKMSFSKNIVVNCRKYANIRWKFFWTREGKWRIMFVF